MARRLIRGISGKLTPCLGNRVSVLSKIFANPVLAIDDYYEPFTYAAPAQRAGGQISADRRLRSLISGERMDKINWGPNWEELLGGEFEKRARDRNFEAMQKRYGQFENTFMMYLALCETASTSSCGHLLERRHLQA
ncbi:Respiratory nitrate reductase 2 beta chain [Klebsiella pneumoniae]|nr:Respiratory nitrate reductase 2 beta chain [Klebsiella pneumoniae]